MIPAGNKAGRFSSVNHTKKTIHHHHHHHHHRHHHQSLIHGFFSSDQHSYEISSSTQDNLIKKIYKTNRYGKYSTTVSAVDSWNKIQKQLKNTLLKDLFPNKIKTVVSNFYLKLY